MMLQPGRRAGLTWFGAALALALACGAALLAWQHGGAARGPSEQLGGAQAFGLSTAAGDSPNALAQMQADSGRFAEDRLAGMVRRLKKRMASLNDMRHSQAMWSAMFMAKTDVQVDTFQALMNATQQAGKGAGSSGGTSEKK